MTYLLMTVESDLIVLLIQAVLKKPTQNRNVSMQAIPNLISNRYGNLLPPITPRIKPP